MGSSARPAVDETDRTLRVKIAIGVVLAAAALVAAIVVVWISAQRRMNTPEALLARASAAFAKNDYAATRELAELSLTGASDTTPALILAGKAAAAQKDLEGALGYFAKVPAGRGKDAVEALMAAGELAYELGRASEAETHLRAALSGEPNHALANGLLAYLLCLEGRSFEAAPFLFAPLKRQGEAPVEHLCLLAGNEPIIENSAHLERFLSRSPKDVAPLIAKARVALQQNRRLEAARLLERIRQDAPHLIEAQARYGELLLDEPPEELASWRRELPEDADRHPVVWLVLGQASERQGQQESAARCYWQALHHDPNHAAATYRLAQTLAALGRPEAETVAARAAMLEELAMAADDIRRDAAATGDPMLLERIEQASTLCESLGRYWEACAWADLASKQAPESTPWAKARLMRLLPQLAPTMPRTLDTHNPATTLDLSDFPLPDLAKRPARREAVGETSHIAFEDSAEQAGVAFIYDNGAVPSDGKVRLIETTGGGVGVLDFDGDGWSDLYFTQGGAWQDGGRYLTPAAEEAARSAGAIDRLFQNLGGERFQDVTEKAGLGDARFSQGVARGDFDNDGFDDLYVANIGVNRLYHNLGDGTFVEVTSQMQATGHYWTTSCLIADVTGDDLPDIFDVNYVANEDLERAVCSRGNEIGGCRPGAFQAAQDRLFVNQGDGQFVDVSEAAGVFGRDGMGLGVAAADFRRAGKLDLFIANDAFPNFFLTRDPDRDAASGQVLFHDEATLNGTAVSYLGKSQACMGVAVGDANSDGWLDVLVTNFYNEGSTLYVQREDGLFHDGTVEFGLRQPSLEMLGFGAQFLDADLDGAEDLIVTNGHVFDLSDRGVPYLMRAQFFRNTGEGGFLEAESATLGEFFRGSRLGRGLAKIDWNLDGKEDVAISHMQSPAALLTNRSRDSGAYLALRLRGVRSSRDAIGAIVTLRAGDLRRIRQLTAGDGYQAANERRLVFGLGQETTIDELTIQWPSGLSQTFSKLGVNADLICVEDAEQLVAAPR